jgi:L-alanine-DL-glutamate epimerase-like enolase superfamily enzyme
MHNKAYITRADLFCYCAPEPTNPDDVLGHAAIRKALKPYGVGVATGEAAQNRVTFKQLLQAEATDVCQIDAVRLGSVNECLVKMTLISHCVLALMNFLSGCNAYGSEVLNSLCTA